MVKATVNKHFFTFMMTADVVTGQFNKRFCGKEFCFKNMKKNKVKICRRVVCVIF